MKPGLSKNPTLNAVNGAKLPASYHMADTTLYTTLMQEIKDFIELMYNKNPAMRKNGDILPLVVSSAGTRVDRLYMENVAHSAYRSLFLNPNPFLKSNIRSDRAASLVESNDYWDSIRDPLHTMLDHCNYSIDTIRDLFVENRRKTRCSIGDEIKTQIALLWCAIESTDLLEKNALQEFFKRLDITMPQNLPEDITSAIVKEYAFLPFLGAINCGYKEKLVAYFERFNHVDLPLNPNEFKESLQAFLSMFPPTLDLEVFKNNLLTPYYLTLLGELVKEEQIQYFNLPNKTTASKTKGHRVAAGIYMQLGETASDVQSHILSYFQIKNVNNYILAGKATYKVGVKVDEDPFDKELGLSDSYYRHHSSKRMFD